MGPLIPEAMADSQTAASIPPHSIEAEQSVLGGLLLDNTTYDQVADHITGEDFYRDHKLIYGAIQALAEEAQPFDVVTVSEWLENQSLGNESGGSSPPPNWPRTLPAPPTSRPMPASCARARCCVGLSRWVPASPTRPTTPRGATARSCWTSREARLRDRRAGCPGSPGFQQHA